jgi:hypothetical protein
MIMNIIEHAFYIKVGPADDIKNAEKRKKFAEFVKG